MVMATVGWIAIVLVALVVLLFLVVGLRSVPDLMRYRRIRRM
jgi:membrane protein YdbS with pleckstrin-like domain